MKQRNVVFKRYEQNQPMLLLPPSYEQLVPENHPVRVVNEVVERIDIGELERSYKGGGTSSYHPRLLLKVVVYGYLRNIYSSRKMEQALSENVHFMWLAGGGGKPDHNTINDFRGKRLKGQLKEIFNQVVMLLLAEAGAVTLKEVVLDGTKIEANANRYTFVWGKAIRVSRERIERQLRELWEYVEKVHEDEENQPNTPRFEAIDPDAVARTIEEINDKKPNSFHADNLAYDEAADTYTCPIGQPMRYVGDKRRRTSTGYLQTHRMYQALNCRGCPMRGPCHKAAGDRTIQRSPSLVRHKQKVKELLISDEGVKKRKQRWQVEAVFGNIKQNKGFRRFNLRGIDKANIEIGLIAIAHNLQRLSTKPGH